MNETQLIKYAPIVLRLGISAVYIWFGIAQITNTSLWVGMVPLWATEFLGVDATTMVLLNGWFELLAATFLILGVYVRWVAALLFIHLAVITIHLGYNPVGVRDFGLSLATLALSLFGADDFCLQSNNKNM